MSEILDNAIDSLKMALTHHLDRDLVNRDKWAILELYHAIELLLKERLHQDDPLLIYCHPNKPITDDSRTIGLEEAFDRLDKSGIEFPDEYKKILRDLKQRRNRIEHHRFVPDNSHRRVLGEALKLVGYFLEDELGEDLKEHLGDELFHTAKELIVDYDELAHRAESAVEAARGRFDPKERVLLDTGTCPDCGNRTVLVGAEAEPRCYFCDATVSVRQCTECGEYLPEDELIGPDICANCFSARVNRDD